MPAPTSSNGAGTTSGGVNSETGKFCCFELLLEKSQGLMAARIVLSLILPQSPQPTMET